jgi:hypothetical protein
VFDKTFAIEGVGEFTLCLSNRAQLAVEKDVGMKQQEITDVFGKAELHSPRIWNSLIYQGLRKHHPKMTREQAEDLLEHMSRIEIVALLSDAWMLGTVGKTFSQLAEDAKEAEASGVPLGLQKTEPAPVVLQ